MNGKYISFGLILLAFLASNARAYSNTTGITGMVYVIGANQTNSTVVTTTTINTTTTTLNTTTTVSQYTGYNPSGSDPSIQAQVLVLPLSATMSDNGQSPVVNGICVAAPPTYIANC